MRWGKDLVYHVEIWHNAKRKWWPSTWCLCTKLSSSANLLWHNQRSAGPVDRGPWACLLQQLRKYLLLPCSLEQSGCILFGTLECLLSPLGEGELHWMSAQLENCPASSSLAVRRAVHARLIHDKMTSHNQRNVKRLITRKSRFKEVKCSLFTSRTATSCLQEQLSATNYVRAWTLATSGSHSADFDGGVGSRDKSWTAVKGLWTLAVCTRAPWVGTR